MAKNPNPKMNAEIVEMLKGKGIDVKAIETNLDKLGPVLLAWAHKTQETGDDCGTRSIMQLATAAALLIGLTRYISDPAYDTTAIQIPKINKNAKTYFISGTQPDGKSYMVGVVMEGDKTEARAAFQDVHPDWLIDKVEEQIDG